MSRCLVSRKSKQCECVGLLWKETVLGGEDGSLAKCRLRSDAFVRGMVVGSLTIFVAFCAVRFYFCFRFDRTIGQSGGLCPPVKSLYTSYISFIHRGHEYPSIFMFRFINLRKGNYYTFEFWFLYFSLHLNGGNTFPLSFPFVLMSTHSHFFTIYYDLLERESVIPFISYVTLANFFDHRWKWRKYTS